MGYGDYYWGLYRDYYGDPFPHSLLRTRQPIVQFPVPRWKVVHPLDTSLHSEEWSPGHRQEFSGF